jgi:ribonucleotide reductase alpha subunit
MVVLLFILEPWHADIEEFLRNEKNHGDEEIEHEIYFMLYGFLIYLWNV